MTPVRSSVAFVRLLVATTEASDQSLPGDFGPE
jgi:hypothetical protein